MGLFDLFRTKATVYVSSDRPKGWSIEQNELGEFRAYRDEDRENNRNFWDSGMYKTIDEAVYHAIQSQKAIDISAMRNAWKKLT
jgi:hypothetical protein